MRPGDNGSHGCKINLPISIYMSVNMTVLYYIPLTQNIMEDKWLSQQRNKVFRQYIFKLISMTSLQYA